MAEHVHEMRRQQVEKALRLMPKFEQMADQALEEDRP